MNGLINSCEEIESSELLSREHSNLMPTEKVLKLIVSPINHQVLHVIEKGLTDGNAVFPVKEGSPILYPEEIISATLEGNGIINNIDSSLLQYFLISQMKQQGETNAPGANTHYKRHLYRMSLLLENCKGTILDIGCDDINIGSALLPSGVEYVGLDPFSENSNSNRVVGLGECLPFKECAFDNAMFNTSLDHILDYYLAINEAKRVLKKGGLMHISTLIWHSKSTLLTDSVHFHHFKEYEVLGALKCLGFTIINTYKYCYKDDDHRYGLYLTAEKN
jgi:SAM-dependent methyltransferase